MKNKVLFVLLVGIETGSASIEITSEFSQESINRSFRRSSYTTPENIPRQVNSITWRILTHLYYIISHNSWVIEPSECPSTDGKQTYWICTQELSSVVKKKRVIIYEKMGGNRECSYQDYPESEINMTSMASILHLALFLFVCVCVRLSHTHTHSHT